ANVVFHGPRAGDARRDAGSDRLGQLELPLHERPQVEPGHSARRVVARGDHARREERPGVDEGLRVREDARQLDDLKQGAEIVGGIVKNRLVEVGGGSGGCAGRRGARDRRREEQPPPTSTTSTNLHQPCRSHLNTTPNTPSRIASNTESPISNHRAPAVSPSFTATASSPMAGLP